jgi:hypothetical protein
MLQKNQIEVSITPLSIFADRLDFIDYGCLTWTTTPTTVFRHPQTGLRNIFSEPLSLGLVDDSPRSIPSFCTDCGISEASFRPGNHFHSSFDHHYGDFLSAGIHRKL